MNDAAQDQLFREARSYKAFEPTPIPPETLRAVYDLAKWGPTAANTTPARFLFLTSEDARAELAERADVGNRPKIMSAPCVVVIGLDLDFPQTMGFLAPHAPDAVNWWPEEERRGVDALRNSTLQGAYLMMAARTLGLDCGPMGGFDRAAVDAHFFAETNIKSNFICALGHGTTQALRPRAPRFAFDEVCKIL